MMIYFKRIASLTFLLSILNSVNALDIPTPQKIIPDNVSEGEMFGSNVSISGNFALIAADSTLDGNAYSEAYIFEYDGNTWLEKQELFPSDNNFGFVFELEVDIQGYRAIIGEYEDQTNGLVAGAAYIFEYNGASWIEMQKIIPIDNESGDFFGGGVAISGDVAFIGAPGVGDDGSGAVYVYKYNGQQWEESQKIIPESKINSGSFGYSVAESNGRIFISASKDNDINNESGVVHVYELQGETWHETHKLVGSDALSINNFGSVVHVFRNRALIGSTSRNNGAAYLFEFDGSHWNEIQKLESSDGSAAEYFGLSVGILNNSLFVGARTSDVGSDSGSVYVFEQNNQTWVETTKIIPNGVLSFDFFGSHISSDNSRLLISSPGDDDNGNESGSAYIYDFDPIFYSNFD